MKTTPKHAVKRAMERGTVALRHALLPIAIALTASCTHKQGAPAMAMDLVAKQAVEKTATVELPGFEDAVAEIVTTLAATPECTDTQPWTPAAAGTVRLVGTLQKLTEDAEAEVRVLVNGTQLWKRGFNRGDSIRHGVDILVCDLTKGSTVKLEAVTGPDSASVRVAAALQVVPEPLVTRWAPDLPTGYPTFTEERKKRLRQKGQDILQAIRDASAAGDGRIVIPPGDYLFHARWSQASTLRDLADLEIVAEGATFWFEPPMIHALLLENCRHVTIRGLTIDFTLPCWFQARVTDIDRKKKTVCARLMQGYEPRNADGHAETRGSRAFMFYDADGRFINHGPSPGTWRLSDNGTTVFCRDIKRCGIPDALKPGDYIVGTIRTGAALRTVKCTDMRYEDVNIWSSPGMGIYEGGGAGGNVYRRVRVTRRPHTNRLHALGADGFHLAGTDRGPMLDRCESAYGADDTLNIHGSFGRVVQRVDDRHYYLQGAYGVGDTLEFRDMTSVALLGNATALSVTATPDGPSLPINDRYRAKGEVLVTLDTPLELPALALVVLDGKRSAQGFVVRNCWLHDDFQRTLINGAPGGLIENTTLQNVGMGLCIQFETWGPWMEGPFARDLVIRNCRFLDSPPTGPVISVSMHPPGGGSNRRRFDAKPVTNMTIEGNYIGKTEGIPVSVHNVDGLKIYGNSIDRPATATASPTNAFNWLYLQDCDNVSVENNLPPLPSPAR